MPRIPGNLPGMDNSPGGGDAPGSGGSGGRRRPSPYGAGYNPFDIGLDPFKDALAQLNPQFLDISQQLIQQGLGGAENPLIAAQRQRALEGTRGALSTRGITGSVAMNELGRVNQQYDELGLANQSQALQGGLGLGQSALQNLLAIPGLKVAQQGAAAAGQGGGKK